MTVWFTGDTHFSHANIIEYCNRPFASVEEMDETLIRNWNDRVKPGDIVYHLGDFAFHKKADEVKQLANRLNGQIHLVYGNHDWKPTHKAEGCFVWRGHKKLIKIDGIKISLNHYAEEVWWCSHHGGWMLHGHSHGTMPVRGMRVDVGVDGWQYCPVDFNMVSAVMERRQANLSDYHGRTVGRAQR